MLNIYGVELLTWLDGELFYPQRLLRNPGNFVDFLDVKLEQMAKNTLFKKDTFNFFWTA